ncbi:hypothetical protein QWY90_09045 [Flavobacterium paronense]|uniref:DUF6929 family protein n=1 Tax=Flavobacterium paronense TaxID=1392775 RepID=A0ABV5GAH4_9FLAO|nr:hypothetical protein [Flavobacterium paronense]MDN3677464.1 hypothetical protein [Flavobacterium paronense]
MEKFQLSAFTTIKGIGATSGIVFQDNSLFIVSDNSTFLYQYNINDKTLKKLKLFENSQENIAKKDKADFEAITLFDNKLYLFGSGSTKKRDVRVTFTLENKEVKEKSLAKIYKRLRDTISLAEDELNIEGAIITKTIIYYFQRGNGVNAQNGVFSYDKKNKTVEFVLTTLPKINKIEATFTDAILIDETIYFLAAAENTSSTYDDGEVMGSIIGTIDFKTMKLKNYIQISDKHKFEGLTLYKKTATEIELLLCEDNDSEELVSTIYKLVLKNQ